MARTAPPVGVGTLMYVGDDEVAPASANPASSPLHRVIAALGPTKLKVVGAGALAYGLTGSVRPFRKTAIAGGAVALALGLGLLGT